MLNEEERKEKLARLEALLAEARALPPMTARQREEQAFDFAHGNLAASTDHKPQRDAFAKLAADRGSNG
jgi:hypothetical protein